MYANNAWKTDQALYAQACFILTHLWFGGRQEQSRCRQRNPVRYNTPPQKGRRKKGGEEPSWQHRSSGWIPTRRKGEKAEDLKLEAEALKLEAEDI